jgi:hypothetical protein
VTKIDSVELATKLVKEKLGIEFETRESSYIGEHSSYKEEIIADMLRVEPNFFDDYWKEKEHKDYPTIIEISNTKGKNIDKEARHNFLRQKLSEIEEFVMIKDKILETKN